VNHPLFFQTPKCENHESSLIKDSSTFDIDESTQTQINGCSTNWLAKNEGGGSLSMVDTPYSLDFDAVSLGEAQ
jgi:hypothetical protein